MFIFGIAVVFKLFSIQFIQGDKYREMADKRDIKEMVIPANRGNVYSSNGNLLATSIPKYDIRFDALASSNKNFEKHIKGLSDSLSVYFGKPSSYYTQKLRKERKNKSRYLLLARNIGYSQYLRFRSFPLLNLGAYKGGLIVEQSTKREYPLGVVAQRTIGYERKDEAGNVTRPGIDGAFGESYLKGKDGLRLKQKIGKGQWKPIVDYDHVEPVDGYDVYTTIDVNIQDIAHHALLEQLEYYEAEHGCVVVMDVKTGEIKAIANLGRTSTNTYYEKLNYAVGESHEPGSSFKLMALMVALEDKKIDTSTIVDTGRGKKHFYGRYITDSKTGGYGKISAARALEVSSNIGLATLIDDAYADNPQQFIDKLKSWHLNERLGVAIKGEGKPDIPQPGDKKWSRNALPSIAYGYNLRLTPLQTLAFYNAIANNGKMVKPRFIKEVKEHSKSIEKFDEMILVDQIASKETLDKIHEILKNTVERGTGSSLYSKYFSMAGKTGTTRVEYWKDGWEENPKYISSFTGYFPAENPKYSCIVVIHEPKVKKGFYGADVSGPVFKKVAQKIFTDTPIKEEIKSLNAETVQLTKDYNSYNDKARTYITIMPSVVGLPVMDAVALLENMGLKVVFNKTGRVKSQSISKGIKVKANQTIELEVS
ncbi:penicillin-binding protein [Aurantibacter aestuarii]|uniref:Penicillin-binding protein n=1 Tax=Aurantibacter aestuarii TaxID=1266046 RepID=A0A2T1NFM8_9FLAO|nr:penicillin-binding protein [Aurantibacter aestuarii]PSG91563.1 penicillin-binding protein [Aurantibacter aestuarii]